MMRTVLYRLQSDTVSSCDRCARYAAVPTSAIRLSHGDTRHDEGDTHYRVDLSHDRRWSRRLVSDLALRDDTLERRSRPSIPDLHAALCIRRREHDTNGVLPHDLCCSSTSHLQPGSVGAPLQIDDRAVACLVQCVVYCTLATRVDNNQ